ncbi:hypothetical protein H0H81_005451, partial [Sphagnurus paluster]
CDNDINPPTQRVSDSDCRQVCSANHGQYCGNLNRIAVYRFAAPGTPSGPQPCIATDVANFTLLAKYKNTPASGPAAVPLKVVVAELVPNVVWGVLSACPTCCTEWPYFQLKNSIVFPRAPLNPSLQASSTAPGDGETPNFVSSNPGFPGVQAYCTMVSCSTHPTHPNEF